MDNIACKFFTIPKSFIKILKFFNLNFTFFHFRSTHQLASYLTIRILLFPILLSVHTLHVCICSCKSIWRTVHETISLMVNGYMVFLVWSRVVCYFNFLCFCNASKPSPQPSKKCCSHVWYRLEDEPHPGVNKKKKLKKFPPFCALVTCVYIYSFIPTQSPECIDGVHAEWEKWDCIYFMEYLFCPPTFRENPFFYFMYRFFSATFSTMPRLFLVWNIYDTGFTIWHTDMARLSPHRVISKNKNKMCLVSLIGSICVVLLTHFSEETEGNFN